MACCAGMHCVYLSLHVLAVFCLHFLGVSARWQLFRKCFFVFVSNPIYKQAHAPIHTLCAAFCMQIARRIDGGDPFSACFAYLAIAKIGSKRMKNPKVMPKERKPRQFDTFARLAAKLLCVYLAAGVS